MSTTVVAGTPAVREARDVAAEHAQVRLRLAHRRSQTRVQTEHLARRREIRRLRETGMPVRNTATKSLRGKLFGARTPALPNNASSKLRQRRIGHVLSGTADLHRPLACAEHFPRNDLVAVFLTGIPGLTKPANLTRRARCSV